MNYEAENFLPPGAKIKVIGVGGGGGNAVNTMIRTKVEGVDFITANTDIQALKFSLSPTKIQIGRELTKGLGAGADPDVGRDAMLEDRHAIGEAIDGAHMVFVTAGMGGGTGTGGAAVAAQIAREQGALTVGVVTKPFTFEGKRRCKHAESGIERLKEHVDTLIVIPNQRLLQVADPSITMVDAFKMADDVLVNAVKGISNIINIPGMINVDFADVKTVMSSMGLALMGIGEAEGEARATEAARQAIASPLLEDVDIEGATGILINITASENLSLMELNEACSIVQDAAHEDANIIFGTVMDETLGSAVRVTVIATGFPSEDELRANEKVSLLKEQNPGLLSRPAVPASALRTPDSVMSTSPQPQQPAAAPVYQETQTIVPQSTTIESNMVKDPVTKIAEPVITTTETLNVVEQPVEETVQVPTLTPEMLSAHTDLVINNIQETETTNIETLAFEVQDSNQQNPIETLEDEVQEDIFKEEPTAVFTPIETPVVSSEIKIEGATVADNDPRLDEEVVNDMADMDRKIDEALRLAEQINTNEEVTNSDEIEVPSFLRNTLSDLNLS